MGVDVADFRLVGSIPPYFWELLQGVGTRNPPVCEKSWVVPPWIGRTLGGFHQRVTRWIAKMQPNRDVTGRWIYPLLDAAMKAVEMEEVDMYVLRIQNTIAHYISTPPILELCLVVEIWSGAQVAMRW